MKSRALKIKPPNPLQWILDLVEDHPTFAHKKMFGGDVIYLHGKQAFFLATPDEPWNGFLVCTSREYHESLLAEFPVLRPHEILGKWLYVSQSEATFEGLVEALTARALRGDSRFGIEPGTRKKRKKTAR